MCTRLLRNMFPPDSFEKWLKINIKKIRFPMKNNLMTTKTIKDNYNYNFLKNNEIGKTYTNFKFILGISLMTSLWYETNKDDVEENLAHLITLAKIALERGDIERAEEILHLGLQLSEEHKLYTAVPSLYDILSKISLGVGDVKRAQDLCVTAIEKLITWGYDEDDYNIVDFKLKLARIHSATSQNVLAKIGFDLCLKELENKIKKGDTSDKTGLLYINILFWYGVHMIKLDNFAGAKSMINTAYEYSTKIKGLSVKQEMIILYMLSNVHIELGDYENALICILNAIILGKSISSVDLPLCYIKLGYIYKQIGNIIESKFAYNEAIRTAKTFGFYDVIMDAEEALQEIDDDKINY